MEWLKIDRVKKYVKNAITRNFKPIWETSDRYAAFDLCNKIRKKVKEPGYSADRLDLAYQFTNIFDEDYKHAKDEFFLFVTGLF